MEQFDLTFTHDAGTLRAWLERETGVGVTLAVTDNSARMISVRGAGCRVSVRVHRIFLSAPHGVLLELASFVKNRRDASPVIRRYIKENASSIKERPGRRVSLRTRGEHHDLQGLFDAINAEYFGSSVKALITWGRGQSGSRARRRTLGSYNHRGGVIRINQLLDSRRVPGYFVASVVYHEMLHAHMGVADVQAGSGRRSIHSKEFRERERLFRDYARAAEWERSGRSVSRTG